MSWERRGGGGGGNKKRNEIDEENRGERGWKERKKKRVGNGKIKAKA